MRGFFISYSEIITYKSIYWISTVANNKGTNKPKNNSLVLPKLTADTYPQ